MRRSDPAFKSVFFSIDFAMAVERTRPDATILVFKKADKVLAFLPVQYQSPGHAVPIGGAYNDAHGLLYHKEQSTPSYLELLKIAKLQSFTFHSLETVTEESTRFSFGSTPSFLADLGSHQTSYVEFLEQTRETIFKQRRKTKKMVRDLGPMRLIFDCRDPIVWKQLVELKKQQYQRTNIFDLLSVDWMYRLLQELCLSSEPNQGCRGITSALFAGDVLVAGHIGLIEDDLLHYWFPVYDPQYHAYSPGTALFLGISNTAEQAGIQKIDFGYGDQPYKRKLTDTISQMQFGRFDVSPTRWLRSRSAFWISSQRKKLPFRETVKKYLRAAWPTFGGARYR